MAQIQESGDGKSLNVDLNIVPFIDLMSCLTAFLLVSAVWVSIAQLPVEPAGRGREQPCEGDCDQPRLSLLIAADHVTLGVSRVDDFETIANVDGKPDWARLESRLAQHKTSAFFVDSREIELAAESTTADPVAYQTLIAAMDVAVKTGFSDVGLSDPLSLSARPPR